MLLVSFAFAADLPAPIEAATALSASKLEDLTPWRATVATISALTTASGVTLRPVAGSTNPPPFDAVVLADLGASVRMGADWGNVRIIVSVPRTDLATVPTGRVRLDLEPPVKGAFVDLFGGTPMTAVPAGDRVNVVVTHGGLSVEGTLPKESIGQVWRREAPAWGASELAFDNPLDVRDAPRGHTIALCIPGGAVTLVGVGAPRDGWREVELRTLDAVVHGWVVEGAVHPEEGGLGGLGTRGGGRGVSGPRVTLGAGVGIGAGKGSDTFARTVREAQMDLLGREGTLAHVRFGTPWGLVDGWVDCSHEGAPGPGASLRCDAG